MVHIIIINQVNAKTQQQQQTLQWKIGITTHHLHTQSIWHKRSCENSKWFLVFIEMANQDYYNAVLKRHPFGQISDIEICI